MKSYQLINPKHLEFTKEDLRNRRKLLNRSLPSPIVYELTKINEGAAVKKFVRNGLLLDEMWVPTLGQDGLPQDTFRLGERVAWLSPAVKFLVDVQGDITATLRAQGVGLGSDAMVIATDQQAPNASSALLFKTSFNFRQGDINVSPTARGVTLPSEEAFRNFNFNNNPYFVQLLASTSLGLSTSYYVGPFKIVE